MGGALPFHYIGYRIVKGAFVMMRLVDLLFDPMDMDFWKWRIDGAPCGCNVMLM